ncbi:unnamed protein product, partial [Gulo gulo]
APALKDSWLHLAEPPQGPIPRCHRGGAQPHLQLTPGHLHRGVGVQPSIHRLERATSNLDVKLEVSAVWGRCHGLGLRILLFLLL